MKRNSLLTAVVAGIAACAGMVALADATPFQPSAGEYVEFIFSQNVSVETVYGCAKFNIANDVNGVGYLVATGCSATGPLVQQNGTSGNVSVDVTLTTGAHYVFTGCRVATHGNPNFWQIGMFCT